LGASVVGTGRAFIQSRVKHASSPAYSLKPGLPTSAKWLTTSRRSSRGPFRAAVKKCRTTIIARKSIPSMCRR
jgi:hypothetical protein